MTPEEEKAFFQKLEAQFPESQVPSEPEGTILLPADFNYAVVALASHVPPSPERDKIVAILCRCHRDLYQLYQDLVAITQSRKDTGTEK